MMSSLRKKDDDKRHHSSSGVSGDNKKQKVTAQIPTRSNNINSNSNSNSNSSPTLTILPEAVLTKIFQFIATEKELSKLIRVRKQFSNIICHNINNNKDDKFEIKIYKKEFIPCITINPKIKDCVGIKIVKRFCGQYHRGKVTFYDQRTGYYKVKYTDGDKEEMNEDELDKYQVPKKQKIWHGHQFLMSPKGLLVKLRQMYNDVSSNIHDCTPMIVKDVDMFEDISLRISTRGGSTEWQRIRRIYYRHNILDTIISLNLALPLPSSRVGDSSPCMLAEMLPNLRELDVSNIIMNETTLGRFSKCCPHLEKITLNNYDGLNLDFRCLSTSTNLKELYIDDSTFTLPAPFQFRHINVNFIFRGCYEKLERVSIRNFRRANHKDQDASNYVETMSPPSQRELVKFVRTAPLLRWFRSDLSKTNMNMLQQEFPEIEFLN